MLVEYNEDGTIKQEYSFFGGIYNPFAPGDYEDKYDSSGNIIERFDKKFGILTKFLQEQEEYGMKYRPSESFFGKKQISSAFYFPKPNREFSIELTGMLNDRKMLDKIVDENGAFHFEINRIPLSERADWKDYMHMSVKTYFDKNGDQTGIFVTYNYLGEIVSVKLKPTDASCVKRIVSFDARNDAFARGDYKAIKSTEWQSVSEVCFYKNDAVKDYSKGKISHKKSKSQEFGEALNELIDKKTNNENAQVIPMKKKSKRAVDYVMSKGVIWLERNNIKKVNELFLKLDNPFHNK